MSFVLSPFRTKPQIHQNRAIKGLAEALDALDADAKAFIGCLTVTIFFALFRVAYGMTLPTSPDTDLHVLALLGSTILALSLAPAVRMMRRLVAVARAVGILVVVKIALLSTVFDVYWTGRWRPLADGLLADFDRMLGFDWMTYVGSIDAHPFLLTPLYFAYQSIWWQPTVIGLVLAAGHQIQRLHVMVTVNGASLFVTSCVTVFFPAYGAYTYFGASLNTLPHLELGDLGKMKLPLDHLRSGIFNPADLGVALVQFPSFHATEAVVMAWAAWRTPLRWPAIVLNVAMLASAPVFGSHYLSDILAGGAIGAVTIYAIKRVADFASAVDLCSLLERLCGQDGRGSFGDVGLATFSKNARA